MYNLGITVTPLNRYGICWGRTCDTTGQAVAGSPFFRVLFTYISVFQCKSTPASTPRGTYTSRGNHLEDEARYSCDDGYVMQGNPVAMCQPTGQWGAPPCCRSKWILTGLEKYAQSCRVTSSVGVIWRTSKCSSVGMTEDVYRSLKFKHRFSELSRAKQQKRPFVADLSNIWCFYSEILAFLWLFKKHFHLLIFWP